MQTAARATSLGRISARQLRRPFSRLVATIVFSSKNKLQTSPMFIVAAVADALRCIQNVNKEQKKCKRSSAARATKARRDVAGPSSPLIVPTSLVHSDKNNSHSPNAGRHSHGSDLCSAVRHVVGMQNLRNKAQMMLSVLRWVCSLAVGGWGMGWGC